MSLTREDKGGNGNGAASGSAGAAPQFDYSNPSGWLETMSVFLQRNGAEGVHTRLQAKEKFDELERQVAQFAQDEVDEALAFLNDAGSGAASASATKALDVKVQDKDAATQLKESRRVLRVLMERLRKVYGIVWQALPEELRAQTQHISPGHANGLWTWLTAKFESTEQDRVADLLLKWQQLAQGEDEPIDSWRARVMKLAAQLEQVGEKPSARMLQWTYTDKLHKRYLPAVLALKASGKLKDAASINYEEIAQFLNSHERNVERAEVDDAKVMVATGYGGGGRSGAQGQRSHAREMQSSSASRAGRDRGNRDRPRPPRTLDDVQCFSCGGYGHLKVDCPQKRQGGNGAGNCDAAGGQGGEDQILDRVALDEAVTVAAASRGSRSPRPPPQPREVSNAPNTPRAIARTDPLTKRTTWRTSLQLSHSGLSSLPSWSTRRAGATQPWPTQLQWRPRRHRCGYRCLRLLSRRCRSWSPRLSGPRCL